MAVGAGVAVRVGVGAAVGLMVGAGVRVGRMRVGVGADVGAAVGLVADVGTDVGVLTRIAVAIGATGEGAAVARVDVTVWAIDVAVAVGAGRVPVGEIAGMISVWLHAERKKLIAIRKTANRRDFGVKGILLSNHLFKQRSDLGRFLERITHVFDLGV